MNQRCNNLKNGWRIGEVYCNADGYAGKNCEKATPGVISPLCWGCFPPYNPQAEREKVRMIKGGEIVFEDLWRIYRNKIGKDEFDYSIFHNGKYFASARSLARAEGIIKAMRGKDGE